MIRRTIETIRAIREGKGRPTGADSRSTSRRSWRAREELFAADRRRDRSSDRGPR